MRGPEPPRLDANPKKRPPASFATAAFAESVDAP